MAGILIYALILLLILGGVYWLWMAIQLGSFWMFAIGLVFPISGIVTCPVGAWSLLFGIPDWIHNLFG
ncbi:TPA: maltose ABC transporter permease [Candidatus Poribacteria bacterium]|nr:maltose ABC transporter permease [Candidatus Poribacteria bacterium]